MNKNKNNSLEVAFFFQNVCIKCFGKFYFHFSFNLHYFSNSFPHK